MIDLEKFIERKLIMKKLTVTIVVMASFLLTACSSRIKNVPIDISRLMPDRWDVKIENPEPKPEWVRDNSTLQDKKEGYQYFFSLSADKVKTEQYAWDDAYKHAVKEVLHQAIGVEIETDEIITTKTAQKASEVINPTIEASEKLSLSSKGLIRGVKSFRRYTQKIAEYSGDIFLNSYYKVYLVVEVSEKDIETAKRRSEEEKKERKVKERIENETLADKAERLVGKLAKNFGTASHDSPLHVTMGNFKYGRTACSGPFIEGFKGLIEGKINDSKTFLLKGRLNIKDLSGKTGLDPNRETDQAKFLHTAILYGNYTDMEDNVSVTVSIIDEYGKGASATEYIGMGKIKKDIVAKGCRKSKTFFSEIEPLREPDFFFRLWTDNPGGAYKKGDAIDIYLESSERCYLKVFNIDQKGSITVLDDNTNKSRLIKNKKYSIGVTASQAGVETLLVIASKKEFPYAIEAGKEILKDEFLSIINVFRKSEGKKVEYRTSYTILE